MAITTAHTQSRVIQVMHDMCDIPWTVAATIADHITSDWFTAPIANGIGQIKFRRIAGTRDGYETIVPSDVTATVDMSTGIMVMPTRELVMS
jgi:hypothetical protein